MKINDSRNFMQILLSLLANTPAMLRICTEMKEQNLKKWNQILTLNQILRKIGIQQMVTAQY